MKMNKTLRNVARYPATLRPTSKYSMKTYRSASLPAMTPTGPPFARNYANQPSSEGASTRGEAGGATNIRPGGGPAVTEPQVSGARNSGKGQSPDTKGLANPVSSTDNMNSGDPSPDEDLKRPPEEPDHIKRQYIEKQGQKPLDPADKPEGEQGQGYVIGKSTRS